jgi:Tfp pilus assembly protein FimT
MELMVVIVLMAMLSTIAMPRLLPLITTTEHQNEARHLVGYGRAAMAHAAMTQSNLIIKIDLEMQEYWTESQPDVYTEPDKNDDSYNRNAYDDDDDFIPKDEQELRQASKDIITHKSNEKNRYSDDVRRRSNIKEVDPEFTDEEEQDKILERQKENMEKEFASRARNALYARAKRVQHDERELYGSNSFLDKDEEYATGLNEEQLEKETQPIESDLLTKHRVLESVFIESIVVGEEEYVKEMVEIAISPLGLDTPVSFTLINEDSEVLIVYWDPLTGNAWFVDGDYES